MGSNVIAWIVALLQPGVAAYAFRLYRVFGTRRVGGLVLTTFVMLALLYTCHALAPGGILATHTAGFVLTDAMISILLFIGMAHTESVLAGRLRLEIKEKKLLSRVGTLEDENRELADSNQQLLKQLGVRDRNQENIKRSEEQLRSLFAHHPSPMWIFDLRSRGVLAGNKAALRQYGYSLEEFLSLTAQNLLESAEIASFLLETAKPASSTPPFRFCRHLKKDKTIVEVEVSVVDLRYEDRPARLVVASDVTQHRRPGQEAERAHRLEVKQFAEATARHLSSLTTVIEAYSKNLLLQKIQPPTAADHVQRIASAASKLSEFTRRLGTAAAEDAASNKLLEVVTGDE